MSSALETKQAATQLSGSRISPLAGKPVPREMLVDVARLEKEYFDRKPDLESGGEVWLICRAAIRHRKRLQDL